MRTRILIATLVMFLCGGTIFAQGHYIGVRAGAGAASVRFYPQKETAWMLPNPTFGVVYKYLGGDRFVGGIEVDANYVEKGYKYLLKTDSDTSFHRKVTAIEIPFMWQPHVWMFKNRARFFINAGPYLSYILKSGDEKMVSKKKGVLEVYDYKLDKLRDNRFEYGLSMGAGYGVTIARRVEVLAEFRYVLGFSDMVKNPNKYPLSNIQESPMDQMNVTIGVHYLFNRKNLEPRVRPIKERAAKGAEERPAKQKKQKNKE